MSVLQQMRDTAVRLSPVESIWMQNIQDVPTVVQWVGLAAALAENSLVIPVKLMSPVVGVICLVSVVRLRAST